MKVYEVTINGIVHTMQLADDDVPKGAVEVKQDTPPNKARSTRNKASKTASDNRK